MELLHNTGYGDDTIFIPTGVVMQVQATTDPPAGHRGPAQAGHSQWGDRQDAASRQVHL